MQAVDYARLAARCYHDAPTIGDPVSASRMHVYDGVHCFRGSDDLLSFVHDADCRIVTAVGLGRVHAGFWSALTAILPACLALPRPTAITGHSLGAAMAILYAGVLARMGTIVPVFAFEPPRLCDDDALSEVLAGFHVPFFATRNGNDLVTEVPIGLTLPGPITPIGNALLPFDNFHDHGIDRVIEALEAAEAKEPAVTEVAQ